MRAARAGQEASLFRAGKLATPRRAGGLGRRTQKQRAKADVASLDQRKTLGYSFAMVDFCNTSAPSLWRPCRRGTPVFVESATAKVSLFCFFGVT